MISKLFEPISVGPVSLANRVVMTAMHLNYTPNGEMTDRFVDFYAARARGGGGLIIIGGAEIDDEASGIDSLVSIKHDGFIPGLKRFTDAIHAEGGKVAVQLYQAGAYSFCGLKGIPILAPSEITSYFTRQKTKAMTTDEIHRVRDDFVQAARRAVEAGFDAVEVLGSAGYLICQFLSPLTNKREDEYGGTLENRMRFGLEVVKGVRWEIGPGTGLIVRVAGNDFVPGSHTNKEAKVFAAACRDAGADCINVTGGWHESRIPQITMDLPKGGYVYLARGIKEAVDVPVVACNRINDPVVAEEILMEGSADMIGVARGFLADPEFVNKARAGGLARIRRCVACNQRCFDHVFALKPVGCMVNPRAGKEGDTAIIPTSAPKKILVAGAGPAGCEFACTAAQRGHKVILCDREDHIGGQVLWYAEATGKPEYLNIFNYYGAMIPEYGVDLRLGTAVTPELVSREKPDLVVAATGAAPMKPPIDAVEQPHVVQAWDVLRGKVPTGRNVVVVGGGSVGLETAVYLAAKGTISPEMVYFLTMYKAETMDVIREQMTKGNKNVTVIEMASRVGRDVGQSTRWVLMKQLTIRGVGIVTGATMKDITRDSVVYSTADGKETTIPADTVVLAMGARPENSLAKSLEGMGMEVKVIGDAAKVSRIGDAVEEAFMLAREV
ncbi:MAG: FAD-dependent oxidoreductase [Pseudomonadota bacterium]